MKFLMTFILCMGLAAQALTPSSNKTRVVSVTPVLDTNIYASGDEMGVLFEIPLALEEKGGTGTVISMCVLDKSNGHQNAAFTLHLFQLGPTVTSADNAALSISDAEMAAKYIGSIGVAATDYLSQAVNSVACETGVGLAIKSNTTNSNEGSIWGIMQSQGTPTYGVSDLVLTFGIAPN